MPPSWEAPDPKPGDLWPGYPGTAVFQFDLHYSVDVQIAIAAERLRRFSQHLTERYSYTPISPTPTARRLRVRQFPLYVRMLDAELQGSSIGEIGRVLFPGRADPRNNVKEVRTTARKIAAGGYKDLLLLPPYSAPRGI